MKKKQSKGTDEGTVQTVLAKIHEAQQSARDSGCGFTLCALEGINAKTLQQVLPADSDLAIMLVTASPDGKLHCIAGVPQHHQDNGIKADEWVREALSPVGGRGGGKPGRAQGSAPAEDDALEDVLAAARAYWAQHSGN